MGRWDQSDCAIDVVSSPRGKRARASSISDQLPSALTVVAGRQYNITSTELNKAGYTLLTNTASNDSSTVAIETHGCKLNQADSSLLAEEFATAGYRLVSADEPADIFVVNSCTVTHTADRKARHALRAAAPPEPQRNCGGHGLLRGTLPR